MQYIGTKSDSKSVDTYLKDLVPETDFDFQGYTGQLLTVPAR